MTKRQLLEDIENGSKDFDIDEFMTEYELHEEIDHTVEEEE